jgi:hypothetical protein
MAVVKKYILIYDATGLLGIKRKRIKGRDGK